MQRDDIDKPKGNPCAVCGSDSSFQWWGHWLCAEHGTAWHDAELDLPTTKSAAEVQRLTDAWVAQRCKTGRAA